MKCKKSLISLFLILVCVFSTLGITTATVFADRVEKFENVKVSEIEQQVQKIYYGETVTPQNVGDFTNRKVKYKAMGLDTPFIELSILPSQKGTENEYSPDFERVYLKILDPADSNVKMEISIFEHYISTNSTELSEKNIAINVAGGSEQSLGAEWRGSQIANKDKLGTGWGGHIAQSFDGYVHASGYIDEDGNPITLGSDRAIRLYYDAQTNALYTDVGRGFSWDGVSQDVPANSMITMPNGKYRWCIRDFDKEYNNISWGGFIDGRELDFSVVFDKVKDDKTPKILISKLMGEDLIDSPIIVDTPFKGEKNLAYPIPKPIYYDVVNNTEEEFSGQYKIVRREVSGAVIETISNFTNYVDDATFTPLFEGVYDIIYKTGNDEDKEKIISVGVYKDLEKIQITPKSLPNSCYVYEQFDVGASWSFAFSDVSFEPTVKLKINRNGSLLVDNFEVGENYNYKFNEAGDYEFVYSCLDYLGRETIVKRNVKVQRYSISWKDGAKENLAIPFGDEVVLPSVSDVSVFDIVFNNTVSVQSCEITVAYNGGAYSPIDTVRFDQVGEYKIKYNVQYTADNLEQFEVERKIFIYNEFSEQISVNGLPEGTKLIGNTDSVVIDLKAVKNQNIVIPYNYFNCELTMAKLTAPNGNAVDITEMVAISDYTFKPDSVGVYELFVCVENTNFRSVKILNFDVRDKWAEFIEVVDLNLPIGVDLNEYKPVCKDFYGNDLSFNTELYFMGQAIETDSLILDKYGIYEVVYSYNVNGESTKTSRTVITFDNGQPVLKIHSGKTLAYKNQEIELASYDASDDSGLAPKINITVSHNGQAVDVYNNRFTAIDTGEYVVTYTATDAMGNTITSQYVITVKSYVGIIVPICVAVVALASAIAFVLIIRKKTKRRK